MQRLWHTVLPLLALGLLAGCGHGLLAHRHSAAQTRVTETALAPALDLSAQQYLDQAVATQGPMRAHLQLLAASQLIRQGQTHQAGQLLNQIQAMQLMPSNLQLAQRIRAQLNLRLGQTDAAIGQLNRLLRDTTLAPDQQKIARHMLAEAYAQQHQPLASVQQRILLDRLIEKEAPKQANRRQIWHTLHTLSKPQLDTYLAEPHNTIMQGWLALAQVAHPDFPPTQLPQALRQWQHIYLNHPGQSLLPADWVTRITTYATPPQQIALILPLHGPYAAQGQAVARGLLAAQQFAERTTTNTPPQVTILDSTAEPITALYQAAVQQGTDFVVGPLLKQNIDHLLSDQAITVPTLALNRLDNAVAVPNLFQFALSPTDEAMAVAEQAYAHGLRHALILHPDDAWGQRTADAFGDKWQALGGQIAARMALHAEQTALAHDIRDALAISASQARAHRLQAALGTQHKLRFVPDIRRDVDVIFLAASPDTARQIKPLLNFYYAGQLPVYATSRVYNSAVSPQRNRDLDGIIFCDTPWNIPAAPRSPTATVLYQQLHDRWPGAFTRYRRLFALGVDAYQLISQINRLHLFPGARWQGSTGQLQLSAEGYVLRDLAFAKIHAGQPRYLASLTE